METIFSKIIRKEIPKDILYEDEMVIVFEDIHPIAPVHVLVIPKKPIESIATMEDEDALIIGHMFLVARNMAKNLKISDKGYKLLIRVGHDGGQEIPHLHLHVVGGARLSENIHPITK
ncbi:MAG: histidine triad nucleotide-binding protein [Candidatus Moranbacteria bacterium]|jgi:histidine triad (HIT) family protein|nr:histidine triad nucleotide-binding protein [Candidatus Moranbacteria bacterium]MBP9801126.1 histidine triad nucleotide-binding protein [Candidatus Moranbacteria bacterium]